MRRALALLVALTATACSSAQATGAVVLDEFSIDLPVLSAADDVVLHVRNDGQFPHTLVIADELGRVLVASDPIEPGERTSIPVDLDAGTYQFSCRIVVGTPDGGISDHFELGMVADLDL